MLRGEGFVLDELEASGVIYEGVTGDACLVVIGFGESAVDDHQSASGLDGILTLRGVDGYVTIDDMTDLAFDSESIEDAVATFYPVHDLQGMNTEWRKSPLKNSWVREVIAGIPFYRNNGLK